MTLLMCALQILAEYEQTGKVSEKTIRALRRAIISHHVLLDHVSDYLERDTSHAADGLRKRVKDANEPR